MCLGNKMLPGVLLPTARRSVTAYAEIFSGAVGQTKDVQVMQDWNITSAESKTASCY